MFKWFKPVWGWGVVFVLAGVFTTGTAVAGSGDPIEAANLPSLIDSVRVNGPLDFCGEPVPLERQGVRERFEKELLLTLWDRPQVILWIKRLSRYMPHIERMLADAKMPDDLKYLAVIESALRPHAGSPKGAVGFWQFTRATGRKYGLTVDARRDERRNLFDSTRAAIKYLKFLYDDLGAWALGGGLQHGRSGAESGDPGPGDRGLLPPLFIS